MQKIYDFLRSYDLAKPNRVQRHLDGFSESRIGILLNAYKELANNRDFVVPAQTGAIDIYPDSWQTSDSSHLIRQLAIYANRIYLHDPLIAMVNEWESLDLSIPYQLHFKTHEEKVTHFKVLLSRKIEGILQLRPLVECGIIYITPTDLAFPRKTPLTLYADDIYGPNGSALELIGKKKPSLSPALAEYCVDHLLLRPAVVTNGEPQILAEEITEPRRMVALQFIGDPNPYFYTFWDIKTNVDERRWTARWNYKSETPVDSDTFANWISGIRVETATRRAEHLALDLALATMGNAKFVTSLPASRDIAQLSALGKDDSITSTILNLDLPFFENASFVSIAKARRNEAAFEEFRVVLEKAIEESSKLEDGQQKAQRLEEIVRDVLIAPRAKIDAKMKSLRQNLFYDAIILTGSLASIFITHGTPFIAASFAIAAAGLAKMGKESIVKLNETRGLPGFFYWEVTHKS